MKCVICKNGETHSGTVTVVLERAGATVVVRHVPAQVCENCGEEYLSEREAERLLQVAETAVAEGVQVDVREYVAA